MSGSDSLKTFAEFRGCQVITGCLSVIILLILSYPCYALTLEEQLLPPTQEAQAQQLFEELRCSVCQGQSVKDSNARLAVDLRQAVRHWLQEGLKPDEVRQKLTQRYGEAIYLQEPVSSRTLPLWGVIAVLAVLAIAVACRPLRRRYRA